MNKSAKVALIVFVVLLLDQVLKIWVKTNMGLGDEIKILGQDWALIHFVENPGMAFGWKIGGEYGKLILSIFRIGAVGFLIYLISTLIKTKVPMGLLVSFALILAGALGNIIDSAFYGLIFSASKFHGEMAMIFPPEGGYAPFLYGKVVDMFYFPMFQGHFPDWFPIWAGKPYLFFRPVFNLADSAITVGVLNLILFHRQFFKSDDEEKSVGPEQETPSAEAISKAGAEAGNEANTELENQQEDVSSLAEDRGDQIEEKAPEN